MSHHPIDLAIISNEQTPYRVNLHRRISRECPDLRLWSVFTHELPSSPWTHEEAADIRPVLFGQGEPSSQQSDLLRGRHEWSKAGRVIRWMMDRQIRAVVLLGYNDMGRIRIIDWCRRNEVPCFIFGDSNIRCDGAGRMKAFIKRLLLTPVLARCSGVLHCGRLGRDYFRQYGVGDDRLFPFPYEPGYDTLVSPDRDEIESVRQRFGLKATKRHLLYSGRLVSVKRVDLLLRAFSRIARVRPDWNLVIAGDGPLRNELQSSVEPALCGRIIWAGFIDGPAQLAAVYHCCDVLALPSDYEPWGVVMTEAAAAGLALLASSVVGAAADVLEDGRNGRVFRAGDERHLEECLLNVTGPEISTMRSASPGVLARWRHDTDPVAGLRRALTSAGLRLQPALSEHLSTV